MKNSVGRFVVIVVLLTGCLTRSETVPNSTRWKSPEDVDDWMINYYRKPQPGQVSAALETLQRHQVFVTHRSAEALFAGFLAIVFRDNSQQALSWAEHSDSYSKELRRTVWLALWLSNIRWAHHHLSRRAQDATGEDLDYLQILLNNEPFNLRQLKPANPSHLDMLWGAFFASGESQYVKRIISALTFLDQRRDPFKYATAASAKWSLKSRSLHDAKVLETCRDELGKSSEPIRAHLLDIVSQAEGKAMLVDEREEAARVLKEEFPGEVIEQYRQE